jgi:hypothetical protein
MLKQPDGLIAIFSSVVDSFTHMNMTEAEAMEIGTSEWGEKTAREKLDRGLKDEVLWPGDTDFVSDGLGRWREALETTAFQHGLTELRNTLEEMELGNVAIPERVLEVGTRRDEELASFKDTPSDDETLESKM